MSFLRKFVLYKKKSSLYFSLIYSNLVYCIEIYGSARLKYIKPLISKYNTVLRILQNKPRLYHNMFLYDNYETLPVTSLNKYFILRLMHRFIYARKTLPAAVNELFKSGCDIHSYNTRSKFHFNLSFNKNSNSNLISHTGPSMWWKLPTSIRNISAFNTFSIQCKRYLFKSACT